MSLICRITLDCGTLTLRTRIVVWESPTVAIYRGESQLGLYHMSTLSASRRCVGNGR